MSDASQGPGWWQASDGKWYPPQNPPPPPQPAKKEKTGLLDDGCSKALACLAVPIILVVAIFLLGRSSGDEDAGPSSTTSTTVAPDAVCWEYGGLTACESEVVVFTDGRPGAVYYLDGVVADPDYDLATKCSLIGDEIDRATNKLNDPTLSESTHDTNAVTIKYGEDKAAELGC